MQPESSLKAYLYLYLVVLFWGGNFIVSRTVTSMAYFEVPLMSGLIYGFFRYFIGGLFLATIHLCQKSAHSSQLNGRVPVLIGMVAAAIFVSTSHMSHERIPGGISSILINLNPLMIYILAIGLGLDRVNSYKIGGLGMALIGVCFFLFQEMKVASLESGGILLSLVAMLAWSIYTLSIHRIVGWSPVKTVMVMQLAGALILSPFLVQGYMAGTIFIQWRWESVTAILFGGILSSGTAHFLYLKGIHVIGPAKASAMLILVPVVGVFGDWLLGEFPSSLSLVGGTLALLGVLIIKLAPHQPQ